MTNKPTKLYNYTLAELADMTYLVNPSEELKQTFIERTKKHIELVNKFAEKIGKRFPEHDASKLNVLLDAYCFFSKPLEERTKEENAILDIATYIHITNAPHHPEYWTDTNLSGFTRENPTPNGIIDATEMIEESLIEMCCDWCSVSVEKGNTPMAWFNSVNGVRWLFTQTQQKIIRNTLHRLCQ